MKELIFYIMDEDENKKIVRENISSETCNEISNHSSRNMVTSCDELPAKIHIKQELNEDSAFEEELSTDNDEISKTYDVYDSLPIIKQEFDESEKLGETLFVDVECVVKTEVNDEEYNIVFATSEDPLSKPSEVISENFEISPDWGSTDAKPEFKLDFQPDIDEIEASCAAQLPHYLEHIPPNSLPEVNSSNSYECQSSALETNPSPPPLNSLPSFQVFETSYAKAIRLFDIVVPEDHPSSNSNNSEYKCSISSSGQSVITSDTTMDKSDMCILYELLSRSKGLSKSKEISDRKMQTSNSKIIPRFKDPPMITKPYSCSECGKEYQFAPGLIMHQRTHLKTKFHHCDLCGKTFDSANSIACHKRLHSRDMFHYCTRCRRGFRSKSDLSHHEKLHSYTDRVLNI